MFQWNQHHHGANCGTIDRLENIRSLGECVGTSNQQNQPHTGGHHTLSYPQYPLLPPQHPHYYCAPVLHCATAPVMARAHHARPLPENSTDIYVEIGDTNYELASYYRSANEQQLMAPVFGDNQQLNNPCCEQVEHPHEIPEQHRAQTVGDTVT